MKIIAIQSSPNRDGLTARLAQAALQGAAAKGADVELINLNDLEIKPCQACGQGWGHHFQPGEWQAEECIHQDDFASLRAELLAADGIVFSSPVYFGDMSERARIFLDRLRRCDWPLRENSRFRGKPAVIIAAAGGSGNGALEAGVQMEKVMLQFLAMKRVATLPVTRFNQALQLVAAQSAGGLLVEVAQQ